MVRHPEEAPAPTLDGPALTRALATAAAWLERNAAAIDAINVFPVPDGDTGANMARTLRAAVAAVAAAGGEQGAETSAGSVLASAARGALLGARGNSGVILSQWLRGLAGAIAAGGSRDGALDGASVRRALAAGAAAAWSAVERPVEGTILSVARAAAEDGSGPGDAVAALAGALSQAEAAVERTPEQMAVLKAAGVVDAGGKGLAVILDGLVRGLRGEALPPVGPTAGQIDPGWLARAGEAAAEMGYCTEFLLRGAGLDAALVRRTLHGLGDSVLVAGETDVLHVHLHTADPESALAAARAYGTVEAARAEDMGAQHAALARSRPPGSAVAVVAVVQGAGFARLYREIGAAAIIEGGQTFNPSVQQILDAARRTHAADVLVLPNNGNVIGTARQAASLAGSQAASLAGGVRLHVIETRSMAAGLSALLAMDPSAGAAANAAHMQEAADAVLCGAVTIAARATETPVRLAAGQPFALIGEEIIGGGGSTEEALALLVGALRARRAEGSLLTVYTGAGVERDATATAVAALADAAGLEIEVLEGGQPHYPYIVTLD